MLATLSAGCGGAAPPPTEVVVVMQSDLSIPTDVDAVQFFVVGGPLAPVESSNFGGAKLQGDFPVSARVMDDRSASSFSAIALLLKSSGDVAPSLSIVVRRTVTDIPFSAHETMMLVLPMLRRCACQGSTCPLPGDPECDNIARPPLQPFDPAIAPPSSFTPLGAMGLPLQPI
jgi:hypothetical protein